MENNCFYVYVYLDPRKPGQYVYGDLLFDFEPFYVGKGYGRRDRQHVTEYSLRSANHYKNGKIRKILDLDLQPIVLRLYEDLSNLSALSKEIEIIAIIGRSNKKLGPLTNLTDGGEGSTGAVYSDESRALMSQQRKGKKQTPAQYAANCSRGPMSEEHRKKISEAQKGIRRLTPEQYKKLGEMRKGLKHSDEVRLKMSAQRKGKKTDSGSICCNFRTSQKTQRIARFYGFRRLQYFAMSLDVKYHKSRAFISYIRENDIPRVPRNPHIAYRGQWISWHDVFGR